MIYQRSKETYEEQARLNNEAANRVYMGEQAKIDEARKQAAFEAQSILAKSIGTKGKVLASGRSGQSKDCWSLMWSVKQGSPKHKSCLWLNPNESSQLLLWKVLSYKHKAITRPLFQMLLGSLRHIYLKILIFHRLLMELNLASIKNEQNL